MVMVITVIITASIKTIIPTKLVVTHPMRFKITVPSVGLAIMTAVLLLFASVNLFSNFRPTASANDNLANQLSQSTALTFSERLKTYSELRMQQEALLALNPIEPYAWMRLAFLRNATQGNRRHAFEALRFADMIAHPDNVGGLERILMWRDYADVQSEAERAREKELWRIGYRQNWYYLMEMANRRGIWRDLRAALMEDPELAARWNKKHPQ